MSGEPGIVRDAGNELFSEEVNLFAKRLAALRSDRTAADQDLLFAELDLAHEELRVADEEVRAQQDELADLVRSHETARIAHERLLAVLPMPVLTTNPQGVVRSANAAAADLLGTPMHRLLGKPLFSFVDVPARQPLRSGLAQLALGSRVTLQIRTTLRDRHGSCVDVHLIATTTPTRTADPAEVTWLVTALESTREEEDSGIRLAGALVELTRLPFETTDPGNLLTLAAQRCGDALSQPVAVSITLDSPASPTTLATGSKLAQDIDGAQSVAGEGPCLDAWRSKETVATRDVRTDPRWPRLAERLAETPVTGGVAVPLRVGGKVVGTLNVYAREQRFDLDEAVRGVELLATAVSAILNEANLRSELESTAHQLQEALQSRATIDQAKGMVMAAYGCGPDEAFRMLVRSSNATNVKLRDLATRLVDQASAGKALTGLRGREHRRR